MHGCGCALGVSTAILSKVLLQSRVRERAKEAILVHGYGSKGEDRGMGIGTHDASGRSTSSRTLSPILTGGQRRGLGKQEGADSTESERAPAQLKDANPKRGITIPVGP